MPATKHIAIIGVALTLALAVGATATLTPLADSTPDNTQSPTDTSTSTPSAPAPYTNCNYYPIHNTDPGTTNSADGNINGEQLSAETREDIQYWRNDNTNNDSLETTTTANAYARAHSKANITNSTPIAFDCERIDTHTYTFTTTTDTFPSESNIAGTHTNRLHETQDEDDLQYQATVRSSRWDQLGVGTHITENGDIAVTIALIDTNATDTSTTTASGE